MGDKQEEINTWAYVFLRPICVSDEHCQAYVNDFFRGLSHRGVVLKVEIDYGYGDDLVELEQIIKKCGLIKWESLIEKEPTF